MVYLFIGMVIGGTAGLFTGCLLTTAKEADKEIERLNKEIKEKNQINKKSLRYRFTAGTIGVSVWQQE